MVWDTKAIKHMQISKKKHIWHALQGMDKSEHKPHPFESCSCAQKWVLMITTLVDLYKQNALLIDAEAVINDVM